MFEVSEKDVREQPGPAVARCLRRVWPRVPTLVMGRARPPPPRERTRAARLPARAPPPIPAVGATFLGARVKVTRHGSPPGWCWARVSFVARVAAP